MQNSDLGDYIGVESCVDLKTDVDMDAAGGNSSNSSGMDNRRRASYRDTMAEKIYPPPIPSHMPWVMRKYYTSDGRLIIREERVRRHKYFQARRENGRLLLNLIPLDDAVFEEEHEGDDNDDQSEEEKDVNEEEVTEEERETEENESSTVAMESGQPGGGTTCCVYSSMGTDPCGFALAVPPFRPIHT